MLPKVLKEASKKSLQSKNPGDLGGKKEKKETPAAARNPHASFNADQGSGRKTAENNSKKWKATWIER